MVFSGNDPCPCGSGRQFKDCCGGAEARPQAPPSAEVNALVALYNARRYPELEARAREMTLRHPSFGFGWQLLGGALQMQGKDALPAFRKTAELMPGDAQAHYNLGFAYKSLGQLDAAAASYRRAIELRPDYADAHFNLANILKLLGQLDAAAEGYRRVLKIKPDHVQAHYSLGTTLQSLGQLEDAIASYRHVLELKPDHADASNELGNAYLTLGQLSAATACYRKTLEINPNHAYAHNNLGNPLKNLGHIDQAIASYRRAVELKPDFPEAYCNLAAALKRKGNLPEAEDCFKKAQELGYTAARVCDALMLPDIMGTNQEVLESRARFSSKLDQLIADRLTIDDPLRDIDETNFYLAYHGMNDRDLQMKAAKFYAQACPSLLYTAPHRGKATPDRKVRIGFLSKFLYSHSVSVCFARLVKELSFRKEFQVTLISNSRIDERIYAEVVGRRVHLPYNLQQARKRIAELELDILAYLDIGMEPLSYFLAFSRLAPVQCVLAGHPVTSGIPTIDYYLSTDGMEPPDAHEHYSEELVRFPLCPFYYSRPALPETYRTRSELGLAEDRRLYICPMKLQKLHPDFDEAMGRILELDRDGLIVLFDDNKWLHWKPSLVKRFEKTVPEGVRARIVFLPWLKNQAEFLSAIARADVLLDPFHFGIGSTVALTSLTGTPLVTTRGRYMRGRMGGYYCELLGVPECIAQDAESYSMKAVEIARDRSVQDAIRRTILKNNSALYEDLSPVADIAEFFSSVAGTPRAA